MVKEIVSLVREEKGVVNGLESLISSQACKKFVEAKIEILHCKLGVLLSDDGCRMLSTGLILEEAE